MTSAEQRSNTIKNCSRYGRIHELKNWQVYRKNCQTCKTLNHFSKVYKFKQTNWDTRPSTSVKNELHSSYEESEADSTELAIRTIAKDCSNERNEWIEFIQISDLLKILIKFKLDNISQHNAN